MNKDRLKKLLYDLELEYKDIEEKYYEEEKALSQYREDCKNEALELFSKWFYSLWD